MDFRPAAGQDSPGLGPVAALFCFQFAASLATGIIIVLLPFTIAGIGPVSPLAGAMAYAVWAESKSPGCLSPRLTRRLSFWETAVSLAVSVPVMLLLVRKSGISFPPLAWAAIYAVAGLLSFLITWLGLATGRRIEQRMRRKTGGPDAGV